MTIEDIVGEPLMVHGPASAARSRDRVAELLDRVGLRPLRMPAATRTSSPAASASGSAIARALATEPKLLVLDEPVSALDVSIRRASMNLLIDLQDELGLAYLFIAHDLVGGAPDRRRRRGDVPRAHRGDRPGRRRVRPPAPSLHPGADVGRADPGPAGRAQPPADPARGRPAQPHRRDRRLQLPRSVPAVQDARRRASAAVPDRGPRSSDWWTPRRRPATTCRSTRSNRCKSRTTHLQEE